MKKLTPLLLMSLVLACKEEEPRSFEITYEVVTTSGTWMGEYISESGEKLCFCNPPLPASGWKHTFVITKVPFTLHIDGSTDCICRGQAGSPDVTTNIYVNEELVATNTSNWAPGVASADYVVQ